jgi:SAM-dependent methyltransferase
MTLFILSILLSSFLLFQIQPLIGKYILPWFGGTANVWSASLLFFQVMLTGGYAYAVWLSEKLPQRYRRWVHLLLLGGSVLVLGRNFFGWQAPIFPPKFWLGAGSPLGNILKILFVSVGVPYFLLSTNSTLIQVWFNQDFPKRNPYWLYALSNAGSLLGLLTYPTLIEPNFPLDTQAGVWTAAYLLFALLTSVLVWRTKASKRETRSDEKPSAPTRRDYLRWIGFPALASLMLLATTSRITQEIAPIPFLWVIPLVIYLLSFIFSFSGESWYQRRLFVVLLGALTLAYVFVLANRETHYLIQITVYALLLFVIAMIAHGELYRTRPNPAYLTNFYLMNSIGGAVGGLAVNLVAPLIFKGYWEFELGLGITWGIVLSFLLAAAPKRNATKSRLAVRAILAVLVLLGGGYLATNRAPRNILALDRNFYGVTQVTAQGIDDDYRTELVHGSTIHGIQYQAESKKRIPTTYYVEDSGVGVALRNHPARPAPLKIGGIGLGIGTIAAYGQPGDEFIFYEINPMVVEIAEGKHFSFMADSPAKISTVLGDARISLENEFAESGSHQFDLLVVDAFNSDSIPTHLLTQEAFQLYLQHLKPNGLLAIHISNNHIDLRPVVWMQAAQIGWQGYEIANGSSEWVVLTQNETFLKDADVLAVGIPQPETLPALRLWTDDYSNIFQLLR